MNRRAAVRNLAGGVALLLLAGCATQALNSARTDFYQGRFDEANRSLDREPPANDRVLFLMERGMVRLFLGDYEASSRDFISAYDRLTELETYSLSRGGASMVVNDSVKDFRGFPFERTLLHAFTAKAHLGQGRWENAAVEARRLLQSLDPEVLGDYPDDAYSRYLAGACLELIGDTSNAQLQYRKAGDLAPDAKIDPQTGRLGGKTAPVPTNELLVFVLMGRAPRADSARLSEGGHYAELYAGDQLLGRSHELADTAELAFTSYQKDAARQVVKTVTRIAVKETVAYQIEQDNELLGELVRFVLIGLLEKPDTRYWATLPRHLHAARVPCPPGLKEYTIVFKNSSGVPLGRRTIAIPLQQKGPLYVSFARDIGGPATSP